MNPGLGYSSRRTHLRFCAAALWLAAACEDADRGRSPAIDLQNSWPNEDGRYWAYELDAGFYADSVAVTLYAAPEQVPPAPALDEAIRLLSAPLPRKPARTQHAQYMLRFAGTRTTASGATGQNLEATLDGQPVAASGLRSARPDVWRRLVAAHTAAVSRDSFEVLPGAPTFLSGGAWEKRTEQIVRYGPLYLEPSWQYLEADLRPGHEFTFQLIKTLADDVFLHARMHRTVTVSALAGTYANALEVVYLVDYGIAEILGGPGGAPEGYTRGFAIGSVVYAPEVGPVWGEERGLYFVSDAGPTGPQAFLLSNLQATGAPEP